MSNHDKLDDSRGLQNPIWFFHPFFVTGQALFSHDSQDLLWSQVLPMLGLLSGSLEGRGEIGGPWERPPQVDRVFKRRKGDPFGKWPQPPDLGYICGESQFDTGCISHSRVHSANKDCLGVSTRWWACHDFCDDFRVTWVSHVWLTQLRQLRIILRHWARICFDATENKVDLDSQLRANSLNWNCWGMEVRPLPTSQWS